MNLENLKLLREQTGISMIECKKALEEAGDNLKEAKKILREKGKESLKDRGDKTAGSGLIEAYVHANSKIGVLLEIRCESDFVAKSADFKTLAHEIALHIAATKPVFVKEEDINEDFLQQEKEIYQKQFADSGKPENIQKQIIEGKLKKYKADVCLLSQAFVKDQNKTIQGLIDETRAKVGEKIEITRFSRFEI
ncbi:elongation factor Ts [bacterium (Candidatus Gribaldobacteria) CG10_big_fil_rev_8_21_14_0_10_37_21]|uniref:Elongation factor Ts n=2 Tax=Candidatus Gribaldobacteria TaxID=2798536 RepID=A0A2H0UX75_9BACT|nr:MAG: elongation factor Ts [Parcubacteria group bacterium CG1_02_37_13]PIR90680.1 MAG: elongation factor Ts [bacterium (Candidatus Gribaldobacteria) CG10_big_fil_rev_8_21_14_0_10_37_21]